MPRDLVYEANNGAHYEQGNCDGIKCKNYEVCATVLPPDYYNWKGRYVCTSCFNSFGNWDNAGGNGELAFGDGFTCQICLEYKRCLTHPRCNHIMCVGCFNAGWCDEPSGPPDFPYSDEIISEWVGDKDNPKWDVEYPLLRLWDDAYDEWMEGVEVISQSLAYFMHCPMCH
jgi:hypothetical protein